MDEKKQRRDRHGITIATALGVQVWVLVVQEEEEAWGVGVPK